MKLNILLSHPQKEIRKCVAETIEQSGNNCMETDVLRPEEIGLRDDIDLVFAPFFSEKQEPSEVLEMVGNVGNPPLLVTFVEEDDPETQYLLYTSNIFDAIPMVCEPDLIRLKLELYRQYVYLGKRAAGYHGRDVVTGLPGRELFRKELREEMYRCDHMPGFLSITLLNVDFLLLQARQSSMEYVVEFVRRVGNYLTTVVRSKDKVYHIFPEQFVIMHPGANELTSEKAARRIKESLYEEAKSWPNGNLRFSLSTGSSTYSPSDKISEEDLLEAAYENLNWERKFQALPQKVVTSSEPGEEPKVILVIDDDPVTRAYLDKLLTKEGYQVLLAESGQKGRQLLEEKRPQVVLLDWMMPGLDGMEFCRRVRSTPSLCSVYIIVLSMISGTESVVYALETGADDYLSKPLHDKRQELLARIEVGFRIQKMQEKALQAERLQGVLEMAGAFAHEINQPLTAMAGLVDLLFLDLDKNHPGFNVADRLKKQINRLGKLTKKLNHITRYETVEYPDGIKLFDIEKSADG